MGKSCLDAQDVENSLEKAKIIVVCVKNDRNH
jgi:hypothetical protein